MAMSHGLALNAGGMFPDLHRLLTFNGTLLQLSGDEPKSTLPKPVYRVRRFGGIRPDLFVFSRQSPTIRSAKMWVRFQQVAGEARVAPAMLAYG